MSEGDETRAPEQPQAPEASTNEPKEQAAAAPTPAVVGEVAATSDPPTSDAPKRRVRRSRLVTAPEPPAGEAKTTVTTSTDEPKSREKRPPRRRRRRQKPQATGDNPSTAVRTQQRTVYRQDVVGQQTASGKERPPRREPKTTSASAAPKVNEQDKITLLLHPAPKAGGGYRKKKKDGQPKTAKQALQAKTKKQKAPKAAAQPAAKNVELKDAWLEADMTNAANIIADAADAGEALVKAWLDANNAAAIAKTAQLDDVGNKVRKAARRALGVLKSRNIDIPVVPEDAKPAGGPEPFVAMYIPPDASGTSFVSISQRQAGGRYHVADVLFRARAGIVHSQTARLASKHIKEWQKRIEKQYGMKPVEVPIDWARHTVAGARKTNDESGQLLPLGFDSCAPLIEPVPEKEPAHPLADLESTEPAAEAVDEATLGSDALHAEPEFRTWLPDRDALDELLRKVGEKVGEQGAADPKVVDEALREEVGAATDRFFSPELRTELAERMRGSAISVRARSGDEAAKRILALAKAIREAGLITSPPSDIPFLLSFFQKAVAMMARQGKGQLRVPVSRQPNAG